MNNLWIPKYMDKTRNALKALDAGELSEARHLGQVAASYFERAINWEAARLLEATKHRRQNL